MRKETYSSHRIKSAGTLGRPTWRKRRSLSWATSSSSRSAFLQKCKCSHYIKVLVQVELARVGQSSEWCCKRASWGSANARCAASIQRLHLQLAHGTAPASMNCSTMVCCGIHSNECSPLQPSHPPDVAGCRLPVTVKRLGPPPPLSRELGCAGRCTLRRLQLFLQPLHLPRAGSKAVRQRMKGSRGR